MLQRHLIILIQIIALSMAQQNRVVRRRVYQHKHAQITQLEIPVPRVVVLRQATIPVQLLMILL